jgi:hypothetical protein
VDPPDVESISIGAPLGFLRREDHGEGFPIFRETVLEIFQEKISQLSIEKHGIDNLKALYHATDVHPGD